MRIAKLSPKELAILSAAHLQADATLPELRAATGLRVDTIRYRLKRMLERGIVRLNPIIDVYRLGLVQYGLFFSLSSESARQRGALVRYLISSERVSFVCELGGDFHFGITICARDLADIAAFMDTVAEKFGNIFFEKMVALRMAVTDFRVKHLLGHKHAVQYIGWKVTEERCRIDELDHRILRELAGGTNVSVAGLSRTLGQPYSTVAGRVKRLTEEKVIAGYRYLLNNELLGVHSFLLLIYIKGLRHGFKREFFSFCWKHDHVRYMVECIGGWDYELGVEAEDSHTITRVVQSIQQQFGSDINAIKVLPVFGYPKIVNYPFRSFPLAGTSHTVV